MTNWKPLLLLFTACTPARSTTPPPTSSSARCPAEDWSAIAFVESRGTVQVSGLTGQVTVLEDVRTGRSRTDYVVGPMSGGEGDDGKLHWRKDPGGEVATIDAPEEVARARTDAWIARRGYCSDAGARYRELGMREHLRVVEAVPDGGARVELWIDPQTRLLARTVHADGQDTVVTTYEDYREVHGVHVPFRQIQDSGDARNRVVFESSAVEFPASVPDERFAAPGTAATAAFANGAHATELPFDLLNNHIFITAAVDGKPVRMLVDTGGVNVLTTAAVKKLGLATEGKIGGRGTGTEEVDVALAHPRQLAVGGLQVRDPVFYIFEMPGLADIEGADFDGVVGFELFHRYVVKIDYAANQLTLAEPGALAPSASAMKLPFVLSGKMPLVDGTIDGTPARFTIDTGARNSLTANAPFTQKHGLVAKYKPAFETVTGWGVGGPVKAWPVRFHDVTLGPAKLREVAGDLYTGTQGAHADPDSDANLGGGILHRFVVTFDYANRTMYLDPIAGLPETDPYDHVGMFVKRAAGAFEVLAVTPKGPAERAGVKVGDRIVAIAGAPVAAESLPEWRRRFREDKLGTKVPITVERAGKKLTATIVLAEQLP